MSFFVLYLPALINEARNVSLDLNAIVRVEE
jgi:hypothetical protein